MDSETFSGTGGNHHPPDNLIRSVCQASSAMQQLPKILDALSNMARRSRVQLHRKGIFLGGLWPEKGIHPTDSTKDFKFSPLEDEFWKPGGILKNSRKGMPTLSEMCSFNDFWKRFSFTFPPPPQCRPMRTSRQAGYSSYNAIQEENLQGVLYAPHTVLFLESMAISPNQLPTLQNILMEHLKSHCLTPKEEEILSELQYLRVLFNIPLHKLLRERPKEFVVPLPRRSKRSILCSSNPHMKSLLFHQTVRYLPDTEEQVNRWFTKKVRIFNPLSPSSSRSCLSRWNKGKFCYSRTTPKGAAFLTYPDTSGDETSFEGTIGERSVISWKEGTRFPQMGVDQSLDFRCKKELSRQSMIQSRLCANRLHRRVTYRYRYQRDGFLQTDSDPEFETSKRNSFVYMPKRPNRRKVFRPKRIVKNGRATATGHPIFRTWFKFANHKSTTEKGERHSNSSSSAEDIVRCPKIDDSTLRLQTRRRQAQRAERRRRWRIYLMKVIGFMSCGILSYFMTGKCYILKRKKRIRIADSRERCSSFKSPVEPKPSSDTDTE